LFFSDKATFEINGAINHNCIQIVYTGMMKIYIE